jgi:hypothetical protein
VRGVQALESSVVLRPGQCKLRVYKRAEALERSAIPVLSQDTQCCIGRSKGVARLGLAPRACWMLAKRKQRFDVIGR